MTTWLTDPKVVWWLLGLAAIAGGAYWRLQNNERLLLDLDRRTQALENWRSEAETKLAYYERRLQMLEGD